MQILCEELLKVIRKANKDPAYIDKERKRLGLMARLPKDVAAGITPFYKVAAESELYPNNGGGPERVKGDFMFYSKSGDLTGNPDDLKVSDYWDFGPLNAALAKVGKM